MTKPHGRVSALALAAAVALGVYTSDAQALALGRVTVQSALGEPLRVDIDIPEINADEVASLRATVASPEAFRSAGLEYSPALANVQITLQRRPDGRYFLRLSSDRPVNDPFVDIILEANWSNGRIVRDYTMLFDPPNLRQSAPPVAAQVSPPAPGSAAQGTPIPRAAPVPAPRSTARAPAAPRSESTAAAPAPAPAAPRPAAPAPSGDGQRVTVKPGDTAARIAAAHKPASVSLDQMLVALLRSNPDAFAGNNVNRLKSGAVLDIPSGQEAGLVPTDEARQTIVAQSRDFNEFRRRLAEGLPTRDLRSSDRVATGKVQAQVEDKKPAASSADRLTLSKGAMQGKAGADKIARDRAAQDAATRVAELNKNIADLNRLTTAAGTATPASGAKPGTAGAPAAAASVPRTGVAPIVPATPPAATVASAAKAASAPAPAPAAVASAAKPASAPAAAAAMPASAPAAATAAPTPAASAAANAASAPATVAMPAASAAAPAASAAASAPAVAAAPAAAPAPAPAKPVAKAPPPPPPPEPSLLDELTENPLIPAAAVGVLAMLLGLGFYKVRQRRQAAQVDSSFLESRLQPDSFFGASGGQRIDTAEGGASSSSQTGSSMVYSPSQLDAAGDVDPVAEADVYLAYGRDLQAEEILKEALRTNPQRVAIHAKLLEIYAKRRDAKGFEVVATEAYNLTHGQGPEWEHICEMGRELDANNPMYRPGGQPGEGAVAAAAAATAGAGSYGSTTAMPAPAQEPAASAVDLDLDFSLGDDEPAPTAPAPAAASMSPEPTLTLDVPNVPTPAPSLDMDFGSNAPAAEPPAPMLDLGATEEPVRLDAPDLTLDESSLNFNAPAPAAAAPSPAPAPAAADPGMIEFDLGSLSLDLPGDKKAEGPDTADAPISTAGAPLSTGGLELDTSSDPLATKLALAEEFNAIGDPDGARSLAQEVLAEASGDLKSRAQRLLAEIG